VVDVHEKSMFLSTLQVIQQQLSQMH